MSVDDFFRRYPFSPDRFQVDAARAWENGLSVVVAAPTGSGKTVVAEYAIDRALTRGGKVFYTTPLKALSNQKFGDFAEAYGPARVGLLTGDNSLNPGAPLVVMTTEVLRNMIYEESDLLPGLEAVVLDEVHYLQDRFRGAVWEEVIIHLPPDVRLVCLSATVSNAEEFAEWVATLRGPTRAVIAEGRPVPLHQLLCVGDRRTDHASLLPLFDGQGEALAHPALSRLEPRPAARRGGRLYAPRRLEVIDLLSERSMLPAIVFVFSRAGCDTAAQLCLHSGLRLTNAAEAREARARLERRVKGLSDDDLEVLGYGWFSEALSAGVAPHHAGLVPAFKEAVEECFAEGLVRVVFATETLSLGINMPARTVVIERLSKFTGEAHEMLTPGQYTQLVGRAGRRGIDTVGYAVVLWSPWVPVERVAELASTMSYPLTSSFRPDYNMAANLVRRYPRDEAEDLLNSSFAQFRTDRDLVRLEATLTRRRRSLTDYLAAAQCDRGDTAEYALLLEEASAADTSRKQADEERVRLALGQAKAGDVLWLPGRKGMNLAAVVGKTHSRGGLHGLLVVTETGRTQQVRRKDLVGMPAKVAAIDLPRDLARRAGDKSPEARKLIVEALRNLNVAAGEAPPVSPVAAEEHPEEHPVHGCPDRDRHLTSLRRAEAMRREVERLESRVRRRADALSHTFERVMQVLEALGYVSLWELTARGDLLASLYSDMDLLVAEALAEGVFEGLEPEELAAIASCLTFEPRTLEPGPPLPAGQRLKESLRSLRAIWRDLSFLESEAGLPVTREPHDGFADYAYRWARGEPLDQVLADDELPGGDFVRESKQTIDLLRQLADLDDSAPFGAAADRLERGVVAYSSL